MRNALMVGINYAMESSPGMCVVAIRPPSLVSQAFYLTAPGDRETRTSSGLWKHRCPEGKMFLSMHRESLH